MERANVVPQLLTLMITLFALLRIAHAQSNAFCLTQFALANQACAVLPVTEDPPKNSDQMKLHHDDDNNDDDNDDDGEDEDERKGRHGFGHHGHGHKHGHGHGSKDQHEGEDKEPRANKDCCRWMKEVDKTCVCEALLRLPMFLTKPKHKYSVSVGSSCKLSYRCMGA